MRSLQCSKLLNILTLKEQSFLLDVGAGPPGSEILNYFNTKYELYPNTLQGYNLLVRSVTENNNLQEMLALEKNNKLKSIKRYADFHNFRYHEFDLRDDLLIPEVSEDLIMLTLFLKSKFEKGETLSEEEMQFAQETAFIETYYRDLPDDRRDFNFDDDSYSMESCKDILKRVVGIEPYNNEKLVISQLKESFINNPSQVIKFDRVIRQLRTEPKPVVVNGLIAGSVNTYPELQQVIYHFERKWIELDKLQVEYPRDLPAKYTLSIRRRLCTYQYLDLRPKYDEIMLSLWSKIHQDETLLMSYKEESCQTIIFDESEFWEYIERSMFSFILRNLLSRKRLLKFIIWLRLLRRLQLKLLDKIAVVILILLVLKIEEFIKFFYSSKRIKTPTSL